MGKLDDILNMTDEEAAAALQELEADEPEAANEDDDVTLTEELTDEDPKKVSLEQLESLQRERDGLLKGMKEERKKRQEFQSRLDILTGTVNAILEKRNTSSAANDKGDNTTKKPAIVLEIDEDGNDVLPVEKLEAVLSPYKQEIENLRYLFAMQNQTVNQKSEQDKVIGQILSEDERYPQAHNKYLRARDWANQRVIEWQQDNGWSGPMTGDQAMDFVFDNELETEFANYFPNADLEAVVGNSKRSFRKALNSLTAGPTPETEEPAPVNVKKPNNSRFQKVLNKPSGLAGAKNAKGATLSVTEKVGHLAAEDFLNLSDAEAKALEEAMLAEEKSDGIKF